MVYGNGIVLHWARNSIFYTLTSVVLSVAISVPAGYAFATSNFPGRKLLMTLTLITMLLPGSAMVLRLFLQMNLFRLVDALGSHHSRCVLSVWRVSVVCSLCHGAAKDLWPPDCRRFNSGNCFVTSVCHGQHLVCAVGFPKLWQLEQLFPAFVMLNDSEPFCLWPFRSWLPARPCSTLFAAENSTSSAPRPRWWSQSGRARHHHFHRSPALRGEWRTHRATKE